MKKINKVFKDLWADESGQGATEYILLLVVVVGGVILFGDNIKGMLEEQIEKEQKGNFDSENKVGFF